MALTTGATRTSEPVAAFHYTWRSGVGASADNFVRAPRSPSVAAIITRSGTESAFIFRVT
jgi:hypothetical protein